MEKIPYGFMLSLKEISMRRVTASLWSQTDVLDLCDRYSNAIDKVNNNIKKLGLPSLLIEKIKYLVKPIGSEILEFKKFHEEYLLIRFDKYIFGQIYWAHVGTIDYRKTAENIIRLKMLNIIELYKLACLYCMDDSIPFLWENLPENSKRYFYEHQEYDEYSGKSPLPICWPYILKGEISSLDLKRFNPSREQTHFNQCMFKYLALTGNKAATEYFYRKLTIYVRETYLIRATKYTIDLVFGTEVSEKFPDRKVSENIFYLLSEMGPEQQMEIFKWSPYKGLKCFLDWPWQNIFLDIADRIWTSISEILYVQLLKCISEKMISFKILSKLFQEFFLRGSSDFRKHFVDEECEKGFFLEACFDVHDPETIKLVFGNVDSVDRKRLVCSMSALTIFYKALCNDTQSLVELCFEEAALSGEEKGELKDTFLRILTQRCNLRQCDRTVFKTFCHILDKIPPQTGNQKNSAETNLSIDKK